MSATSPASAPSARRARLEQWAPGLRVLRTYDRSWLPRDLVAGLILSALLIPQGMAYAELAGLPAITGLYTTVICLLAYAIFGPSPRLVLGPDSSLGPMIAAAILPLAAGSADKAIALAGALALLVGLICVVAAAARLGFVADLLSKPVRVGYLAGLAVTIIVGQLPKFFGFSVDADTFLQEMRAIVTQLGQTNLWTFAVGLLTLGDYPWAASLGATISSHPLRRPCGDPRHLSLQSASAWRGDRGHTATGLPFATAATRLAERPADSHRDGIRHLAGRHWRHDLHLGGVRLASGAGDRRQSGARRDWRSERLGRVLPGISNQHERLTHRCCRAIGREDAVDRRGLGRRRARHAVVFSGLSTQPAAGGAGGDSHCGVD